MNGEKLAVSAGVWFQVPDRNRFPGHGLTTIYIDSLQPLHHALKRSSEYLFEDFLCRLDRLVDCLSGRHHADIDLLFAASLRPAMTQAPK
jgi:hypothetical protein